MKSRSLVFLLALVASIWLLGCKAQEDSPAKDEKEAHFVRRIATNYGIAAHMVFALGAQDRIVGIDRSSQDNRFFNALWPDTRTWTLIGRVMDLNIEQTLSLHPDLILVSGKNVTLFRKLENMGLPVLGVVAEDLEELKTSMLILGKWIGRERAALEFVEYYDSTIQEIKTKTSRIKKEERPLIYLAGPMGILSTCSRDMYQAHLIELCGGANASAELTGGTTRHGWTEVSAEQLISWNPQIILLVQYGGGPCEEVLNDPRWQRIDAIKEKTVLMFPSALNPWDYPSPQAVLGIKWLAKTLHPELFREVDMTKEANDFYRRFYGKSFTALGGRL